MAKQPLILVPGVLCTETLWRGQIAALADLADPVVTAEHRRHDRVTEIAAAILAAAPQRFALAGLSMGGMIAFEMLRQQPDRVVRVALLDTNARADAPDQGAVRQARIDLVRRGRFEIVLGLQLTRFLPPERLGDGALVDAVLAMCAEVGPEAYVRQERAVMARPDSRPGLGRIACPTLVLCGEQDSATPPELSREIAAAIPGARLEMLPDCGHLSTMERPEAVNRALRAWLQT